MVIPKRAVFLDRDGIINKAIVTNGHPYPPLRIKDVYLTEGIKKLIEMWHNENYLVIVITNQPDISSHIITENKVNKINSYLKSLIWFDDIFLCPHSDKDNCNCRKPKTGLLEEAKKKYHIDFSKSYMVGDRKKDIEAGKNVGCKTIFVDYQYDEEKPYKPDYIVKSILEIENIWSNINDKNIFRWG